MQINGLGNNLNNNIVGNAAANVLVGGTGVDTLVGGLGNDTYQVDNVGDIVTEAANSGIDAVESSVQFVLPTHVEKLLLTGTGPINGLGNTLGNTITGNNANNSLYGGAGNDALIGGDGVDTLVGGTENDSLTGGTGKDHFVFTSKTEGKDTISDFSVLDDTINVSKASFGGGLSAGAVVTVAQFRLGAVATDSSERFIYNKNTGDLFFDIDGIGGIGQVQFATLSTNLALTNNDIYVIA